MPNPVNEGLEIVRYRGGLGHWSYVFHRLTGVGVLLFLLIHIVDTALVGWGPELYNKAIALYRTPFFRINEIFLFAAVLYHAVNGVRIFIMDLCPGSTRHYRKWLWGSWAVFLILMVPVTLIMIHHMRTPSE
jgi:succinate dehydrogenase / fumarate reductase cytochrome b subunit